MGSYCIFYFLFIYALIDDLKWAGPFLEKVVMHQYNICNIKTNISKSIFECSFISSDKSTGLKGKD